MKKLEELEEIISSSRVAVERRVVADLDEEVVIAIDDEMLGQLWNLEYEKVDIYNVRGK